MQWIPICHLDDDDENDDNSYMLVQARAVTLHIQMKLLCIYSCMHVRTYIQCKIYVIYDDIHTHAR